MSSIAQTSVAVAPNKMNVFYIGVDNPVSVAASGGTDDKVSVSISGGGGSVSKVGPGNYIVRVDQVTDDCIIQVDVDGKFAGVTKFRVRRLPPPIASVGGFSSGTNIPAEAFRKQAGVGMLVKDFPFEVKYEVLGYTFTIDDDNGRIKQVDIQGASFSSEAKQCIDQYVKPGKTVTIDNIRAKDAGGRELRIPSLVYFIK